MKRKKSPVALITILVVAVAGLLLASKPFGRYSKSMEEQMQEMQQEAMAKARAEQAAKPKTETKRDAKAEASEMIAKMRKNKPTGDVPEEGETKSPSIIMPDNPVYVPKPNEAATSSQWYDQK